MGFDKIEHILNQSVSWSENSVLSGTPGRDTFRFPDNSVITVESDEIRAQYDNPNQPGVKNNLVIDSEGKLFRNGVDQQLRFDPEALREVRELLLQKKATE